MKTKRVTTLFGILVMSILLNLTVGCNDDDSDKNIIELIVASKKEMSADWGGVKMERNVVREAGGEWGILYGDISGFEFEEGYEYRLKVKKIVPSAKVQDAYISYELIQQLSKEKKMTIFKSTSYTVSNNARAEGVNLSTEDIAEIENKIKQSSPFNGVNSLILQSIDYYQDQSYSQYIYKINTGKTGVCEIRTEYKDVQITFDFEGDKVCYNIDSDYLILDVTDNYATDYPNLKLAESGIGLKVNR